MKRRLVTTSVSGSFCQRVEYAAFEEASGSQESW